jgi:hypothetical protein
VSKRSRLRLAEIRRSATMNETSTLRRAMAAVEVQEYDPIATGMAAIRTELAVQEPDDRRIEQALEEKQKQEAAEQRQRDSDAALADAIETVSRHRARLGRRTCTAQDGATVRKVFELLRGLTPGVDDDPRGGG